MSEKPRRIRGERHRGAFITLEGIEGAGKSTQAGYILENLARVNIDAIATREPGGSPRAEVLRKLLLSGAIKSMGPAAEAILFAAARIDHIDSTIEPALAAGTFVICDRFADSTRAYQGATGELDPRFLRALERVTLRGLRPDLTLIFDLTVGEGLARVESRRVAGRAIDRFEAESREFHEHVRNQFLAIAALDRIRCIVIDAARSESTVAHAVWDAIYSRFFGRDSLDPAHGA